MEQPQGDGKIEPDAAIERSPSPEPAERVVQRRGCGEPYIPLPEQVQPTSHKARSWLIAALAAALAVGMTLMKTRPSTSPPHQSPSVEAPAR